MKIEKQITKGIIAQIPILKYEIVWRFLCEIQGNSDEVFYWDNNLKSYHIMPIVGIGTMIRDNGKIRESGIIFMDLKEKHVLRFYTAQFLSRFSQYYDSNEFCWLEKT